ncbi:MAG: substrate-binding domain-containing protein [Bacteroidales bacterium]
MEKSPEKTRIKDIAILAGVSEGTVDRVLHNRGNVSPKSRKKVEEALAQIDYKPNIYASALAQKKRTHLICIIPSFNEDEYWEYVSKGIRKAHDEMSMLNVYIHILSFDQYDRESFKEALAKSLKGNPDGILFPPVFTQESLDFIEQIDRLEIPFVFLDSMIEGTNAISYFGQDSFRSGQIAAKLLLSIIDKDSTVAMFHTYRVGDLGTNQTTVRQNGFLNYLSENRATNKAYPIGLNATEHAQNIVLIEKFLLEHPNTKGVVVFNSLAHVATSYFNSINRPDIKIIGYDILQRNRESLLRDEISFLIGQRPEEQGYLGIKVLSEKLLFNRKTDKINFMPIDIVVKENVEYI